eukprot:gnl/MRDRNA2_/MRDRNA2_94913_c0_seq1.p1 gnl/MRDRNA2_/MRDRNA2_94913_c0~~gnl/MRDRNA2_/MRDRNA2_94913_c0_seq1.p1  ORF type:complete len:120 (+),score=35.31 gnl/MRDRNA2_/MRDRNA2_94913_c0_seq1:59-418(+)
MATTTEPEKGFEPSVLWCHGGLEAHLDAWRSTSLNTDQLRNEKEDLTADVAALEARRQELLSSVNNLTVQTKHMVAPLKVQGQKKEDNERLLQEQIAEIHRTREVIDNLKERAQGVLQH